MISFTAHNDEVLRIKNTDTSAFGAGNFYAVFYARLMMLLFLNSLSKRRFIAISHTLKNTVVTVIPGNGRRNCIKGSLCSKALNADELGIIHYKSFTAN